MVESAYSKDYYTRFYVWRSLVESIKFHDPDVDDVFELMTEVYEFLADAEPDPLPTEAYDDPVSDEDDDVAQFPQGYL